MSNWSNASKVLSTIQAGDEIQRVRGDNRGRILSAANCNPPLDDETAKKLGIKINVNWGELLELLCQARGQLTNAFLNNRSFFKVTLPKAPPEHQMDWGQQITEFINQPLQESDEWFEVHNSRWSSVVSYGPGLMFWPKKDHWCPQFCSLADVRIPTDTVRSFKNLDWVAWRINWTPAELLLEVFSDKVNNYWNKDAIKAILKNYKELNFTDASNNYDIETDPEKFIDLVKQNAGFYGSDAVPTIPLYNFYFKDGDRWLMRVVPETGTVKGGEGEKFLWESDLVSWDSWHQILHCQHGDLSVDAPFKFHTERGLGYVLLDATFQTNMSRNRLLQHFNDQCNVWLKVSDNAEKARPQVQEFGDYKVLKQGISVVPQNERHQLVPAIIEMVFGQLKQLTSEGSASYTQQPDTGTKKEQTAFETRVKVEQVNAKMTSILSSAFRYEASAQREIARRFCLKDSTDPDIREFRAKCIEAGIPEQWLNVKLWRVEPVTPLGMGNPTLAQAEVQQLQQIAPSLSPQAQEEIKHESILVITKDWRKAQRWAPLNGPPADSDVKREMVGYFGTLMRGAKIPLSSANLIDQIEALLPLYANEIAICTQMFKMADQREALGLTTVSEYIGRAIKQLSMDKTQVVKVKEYSEIKMRQDNLARGLIQRGEQAAKKAAQQNGDGKNAELAQQLQLKGAEGKQRIALKAAEGRQKLQQRNAEFQQDLQHDALEHRFSQHRQNLETAADIRHDGFKALAEAHRKRLASIPTDDES